MRPLFEVLIVGLLASTPTGCAATSAAPSGGVSEQGRATFTARPWASVSVGGEALCTTRCVKTFAAGNYVAVFTKGSLKLTKPFVVTAGQNTAVAVDFGVGETSTAPNKKGVLLRARPWAKVHINGRSMGITPLRLDLPPGEHVVTFVRGSMKGTRTITVVKDKPLDVTLDFDK